MELHSGSVLQSLARGQAMEAIVMHSCLLNAKLLLWYIPKLLLCIIFGSNDTLFFTLIECVNVYAH